MSPPRQSEDVIENVDKPGSKLEVGDTPNTDRIANHSIQERGNEDAARDGPSGSSKSTTADFENLSAQKIEYTPSVMAEEGNMRLAPEIPEPGSKSSRDVGAKLHSASGDSTILNDDTMSSSITALKPDSDARQAETSGLLSPPTAQVYLDPTPKTPGPSLPPSRSTSSAAAISNFGRALDLPERSPTRSDAGFDERRSTSEDEREADSRSEIQNIMDQFSEEGGGPGVEEVMSPRLEFAGPLLGSPMQHPPRKSSLEPMSPEMARTTRSVEDLRLSPNSPRVPPKDKEKGPAVPSKPGSVRSFSASRTTDERVSSNDVPMLPTGPSLHRPPPPEPEPEPDLPFDFHRFLEQLRHRTADPVAKFLRSFLLEFGKKQWMVHEQVKIIGDFLTFITNKMAQCEVWRDVSDAEFDNAREGMEKLVMNRLYSQTFSPAIPPPQPLPGSKSKRKSVERPIGLGRRGQHQEDVERDDILAQKVSIYGWVKEEHLDISPVGDSGRRFLVLAQQGT
jgi:hypothetical protein